MIRRQSHGWLALTVAAISLGVGADAAGQEVPRTVGDVNRDGEVTAADALLILSHVVGKELPEETIIDPDGDVHCRGTVVHFEVRGPGSFDGPMYDLTRNPIDVRDAQWLLSGVVGIDLPWGVYPAGHCFGYTYEPRHRMYLAPHDRGEGVPYGTETDPLILATGVPKWEWVQPKDVEAAQSGAPQSEVHPWDNGVNNKRGGDGARAGLIRTGSSDPSIVAIPEIQEWTVALARYEARSPGTATVWADWFASRDVVHVLVKEFVPARIVFGVRPHPIFREKLGRDLPNTLLVDGSTSSFVTQFTEFVDNLNRPFGKDVPASEIAWTSSDPDVVQVSSDGTLTGLAKGESTVTAEWDGLSSEVTVTVLDRPSLLLFQLREFFLSWFNGAHKQAPGIVLGVMGDEIASSFGNFGMNDLRREPREAFNNDPSYGFSYVNQLPWDNMLRVLIGARDVLQYEESNPGLVGSAGVGWSYLMQGLALGTLAQLFDKSFIVDENMEELPSSFSPYPDVLDAALGKLDQTIAHGRATSYELPIEWTAGVPLTNVDVVEFAHSLRARFATTVPRTPAERAAANWARVVSDVDAGIMTDWNVITEAGCDIEFSCFHDWTKTWGGSFSTWARADVRMIGPADQSGEFQEWAALPVPDRNAILIDTDDRRVTGGSPQTDGLYFAFEGVNSSPFPPDRGTYDFSDYRGSRFDAYAGPIEGPAAIMNVAEMDFLTAEGLFRQGDQQGAADIINEYRVPNGELQAVSPANPNPDCVPRMADGSCGDLWEVLKYEKRMEVWRHGMGIHYFDDRGWGDLVEGTLIHFPVPGAVLRELGLPIYTFGGVGESGAAPVARAIDPELARLYWENFRARMEEGESGPAPPRSLADAH